MSDSKKREGDFLQEPALTRDNLIISNRETQVNYENRSPLERFQANLQAKTGKPIRQSGSGYSSCCPAHDDANPSFSFKEGTDGRLLVRCFAGCSFDQIAESVDMSPKEFFPYKERENKVYYDYTSAMGEYLYSKVRLTKPEKDFFYVHLDSNRKEQKGRGNAPAVLYKLHEIPSWVAQEKTIFLVEGEKDVEKLIGLGLAATTAPSSKKWEGSFTETLKNADVVLLYDYDTTGVKRRDLILDSLRGRVKSLRVVDLPGFEIVDKDGKDVSDWLAEGHTISDLLEIVKKAQETKIAEKIDQTKRRAIKTNIAALNDPFPVDRMPSILRAFCLEMSEVEQAPLEMCATSLISAVSFAIGKKIEIYEKKEKFHYPSFFFMILAESGERKSSVMEKSFEAITAQKEANKTSYQKKRWIYEAKKETFEKEQKELLAKIKKEKNPEFKNKLYEEIARRRKELEKAKPKYFRNYTSDFTAPALLKGIEEFDGHYAINTPDGGNVLDYMQGKGHGTDGTLNDSVILKATWGDDLNMERIGKGLERDQLDVKKPALSVCIAVQPERSREFWANSGLEGGGMLARILPVVCKTRIGTRFEDENRPEITYTESLKSLLIQKTREILTSNEHHKIRLDSDARVARIRFSNEMETKMGKGKPYEDVSKLVSKITTQAVRMAGFLAYSSVRFSDQGLKTSPPITISKKDWEDAEAIIRWYLNQALNLNRSTPEEYVFLTAKKVAEKIPASTLSKAESFSKREFQRKLLQNMKVPSKTFVQDVLDVLIDHNWIEEIPGNPQKPRYRILTV